LFRARCFVSTPDTNTCRSTSRRCDRFRSAPSRRSRYFISSPHYMRMRFILDLRDSFPGRGSRIIFAGINVAPADHARSDGGSFRKEETHGRRVASEKFLEISGNDRRGGCLLLLSPTDYHDRGVLRNEAIFIVGQLPRVCATRMRAFFGRLSCGQIIMRD